MRLWSLHSCCLEAKGLVALRREGLLAQAVLKKQTMGYKNHPQLIRFKENKNAVHVINQYLWFVHQESKRRGYKFDSTKLDPKKKCGKIIVSSGQIDYEFKHLSRKLKSRCPAQYKINKKMKTILPHPIFKIVAGGIEPWEIINGK